MTMNQKQESILSILAYSLCWGTSMLLNRLTLSYLPFPYFVSAFQLMISVVVIYGANYAGYVTVTRPTVGVNPCFQQQHSSWNKFFESSCSSNDVKLYLLFVFLVVTGTYCRMRSLSLTNLMTVIVFHALTPLVVACFEQAARYVDHHHHHHRRHFREWPSSTQSWIGLLALAVGVYVYASPVGQDEIFFFQTTTSTTTTTTTTTTTMEMSAYVWHVLSVIITALKMVYSKRFVHSVSPPHQTRSGLVLYTSLLGILPTMCLAVLEKEYSRRSVYWEGDNYRIPPEIMAYLFLGALVKTGLSYSGWWCLSLVSATSYSMIEVMNRCLVFLSVLAMQDQLATPSGFALLVSVAGGVIYLQSPTIMQGEKSVAVETFPFPSEQTPESTSTTEIEEIAE